jgi:pimeloyl-ACP methyl ester carboxylesterase
MKAKICEIELAYEEYGSGPAVVLLHDYASNRDLPGNQIEALTVAGYRVIITNLSGLGQESTHGFDPTRHTRHAILLFNYLGIGRAVVFGISRGGLVLLDLMEKFPGRVAAASLVLSPQSVRDIRRLANRPEMRKELRAGQLDQFKKVLLSILPAKPEGGALAALEPLRCWITRVCSRRPQTDGANRAELLSGLEIPPMLVVSDSDSPPAKSSIASRGWRKIQGVNAHLAAFLDSLLPCDADAEDEESFAGKV